MTPWLNGQRVVLTPITQEVHHRAMYALHQDGQNLWMVSEPVTKTYEDFKATYQRGVLRDFALLTPEHEAIGYVWAYHPDLSNGVVYVGMMVRPGIISLKPWYLEGLALFLDFLFQMWPLRKVYFACLDHNYAQFAHGMERVGTKEGTREGVAWYLDRYEDEHNVSISREQWLSSRYANGMTFDRTRRQAHET